MSKNRGGFREEIRISRKVKEAQNKMNTVMVYICKKILDEEYIFITGTDDIINAVMNISGIKIGVMEIQGKEIEIGDKTGIVEKLFMTEKDEDLKGFMDGRDVEKLIGLLIKEVDTGNSNETGISVNMVTLDDNEEFNIDNIEKLLFKVFPRDTIKKNVKEIQQNIVNMIMFDGLLDMQNKIDRKS